MNREKILELMNSNSDDVTFASNLSEAIVKENTAQLDALIHEIHEAVINEEDVPDQTLEYYFGQLTSALYFLEPKSLDKPGFEEDITKANARLKYNEAYAENQLNNAASGKKPTQADNQLYAEMNSIDEQVLNSIYSRANKIIKWKFENAHEVLRTLSKKLSMRINDPTKFISNNNV